MKIRALFLSLFFFLSLVIFSNNTLALECPEGTSPNFPETECVCDNGAPNPPECDGYCADALACNYGEDGECEYESCKECPEGTQGDYPNCICENGAPNPPECDGYCADALACNYGEEEECEYTSCAGCMDIDACNYDAGATIDDESCEYDSCAVSCCADNQALNFDPICPDDEVRPKKIEDGGSCTYCTRGSTDPKCDVYYCDDKDANNDTTQAQCEAQNPDKNCKVDNASKCTYPDEPYCNDFVTPADNAETKDDCDKRVNNPKIKCVKDDSICEYPDYDFCDDVDAYNYDEGGLQCQEDHPNSTCNPKDDKFTCDFPVCTQLIQVSVSCDGVNTQSISISNSYEYDPPEESCSVPSQTDLENIASYLESVVCGGTPIQYPLNGTIDWCPNTPGIQTSINDCSENTCNEGEEWCSFEERCILEGEICHDCGDDGIWCSSILECIPIEETCPPECDLDDCEILDEETNTCVIDPSCIEDMCINIEGNQDVLPPGSSRNILGECDVCSNIEDFQVTVPAGSTRDSFSNNCDLCINQAGFQSSLRLCEERNVNGTCSRKSNCTCDPFDLNCYDYQIDGLCGSAQGKTYQPGETVGGQVIVDGIPTTYSTCYSGVYSSLKFSGNNYTWKCNGIGIGSSNANCSALFGCRDKSEAVCFYTGACMTTKECEDLCVINPSLCDPCLLDPKQCVHDCKTNPSKCLGEVELGSLDTTPPLGSAGFECSVDLNGAFLKYDKNTHCKLTGNAFANYDPTKSCNITSTNGVLLSFKPIDLPLNFFFIAEDVCTDSVYNLTCWQNGKDAETVSVEGSCRVNYRYKEIR